MPIRRHVGLVIALLMMSVSPRLALAQADWPQWRGNGTGVALDADAPLHWDGDHGIAWVTRIPGRGVSSPIVWRDLVIVTSSIEDGARRLVIALDAHTGELRWQTPLEALATPTYPRTGHAAPTPAGDEQRLYVFFDNPGLAALDADGHVLWQRELGPFKDSYNRASSPVLVDDCVVLNLTHRGPSRLLAVVGATGETRWETELPKGHNYATPLLATLADGSRQLVLNGPVVLGFDAGTGAQRWSCRGMREAVNPSAAMLGDLVCASSGRNGPTLLIDPTGEGDITASHVRASVPTGGPYVPSPAAWGRWALIPGDDGRLLVLNSAGEVTLRDRIDARFSASPLVAGARVYWLDETARMYVLDRAALEQSPAKLVVLAENALPEEDETLASPALAHGRLYVRTAKQVYCIVGADLQKDSPTRPRPQRDLPDDVAKLRELYLAQPLGEFADTPLRLAMVEKLAGLHDDADLPAIIELLTTMIEKDGHWDVSEAAMRELGQRGPAAQSALTQLLTTKREAFFKAAAAEALGAVGDASAVVALREEWPKNKRQPQVRATCSQALGQLAQRWPAQGAAVGVELIALLGDSDPTVRHAAALALLINKENLGDQADPARAALTTATTDASELVASAARQALRRWPAEPAAN